MPKGKLNLEPGIAKEKLRRQSERTMMLRIRNRKQKAAILLLLAKVRSMESS